MVTVWRTALQLWLKVFKQQESLYNKMHKNVALYDCFRRTKNRISLAVCLSPYTSDISQTVGENEISVTIFNPLVLKHLSLCQDKRKVMNGFSLYNPFIRCPIVVVFMLHCLVYDRLNCFCTLFRVWILRWRNYFRYPIIASEDSSHLPAKLGTNAPSGNLQLILFYFDTSVFFF